MIHLSIIVPVYKVEEYIGQCLMSIFDGGAEESQYEVIVVNDGTTDKSMDVVREICKGRGNVKIVEQENQGLSAARMAGLAQAEGEYVWFVDSDDWLGEGFVKYICDLLSRESYALYAMPLTEVRGKELEQQYLIEKEKVVSEWEYLSDKRTRVFNAQRYVIRKSLFLNPGLFFPIGLLHEDIYFCFILLYLSREVFLIQQSEYYYRIRNNSIMGSMSGRNLEHIAKNYSMSIRFMRKSVVERSEQKRWGLYMFDNALMDTYYYYFWGMVELTEFTSFLQKRRFYILKEYLKYHSGKEFKKWLGDVYFILCPLRFSRQMGEYRKIM